jgi:predicted transcriptional regulator
MTVKEQVVEVLGMLPEDCTLDDVIYQLYVRDRIARGLAAIEEGKIHTHEEAKARINQRLEKWRASSGPTQPSATSN